MNKATQKAGEENGFFTVGGFAGTVFYVLGPGKMS